MGLDISDDEKWKEIEVRLDVVLESVAKTDAYTNPKLIKLKGNFRTNVHGADIQFGSSVRANTVLKIGKVYRQDGKYCPQVFVKRIKDHKSQLSG